jgi:hypothetical protein
MLQTNSKKNKMRPICYHMTPGNVTRSVWFIERPSTPSHISTIRSRPIYNNGG